MEETLDLDDVVRSVSSLRMSIGSISRRSWASESLREGWSGQGDVFQRSKEEDDDEELKWAAIERLPTFERLKKGFLKQLLDNGKLKYKEVDFTKLGMEAKKHILNAILKTLEQDNENFLCRLRERIDRVGVEVPQIEVRFEHLSVKGDAYTGTRALPTLVNSAMNAIEEILGSIKLLPSKKKVVQILQDVSGIIKPSRMTLLLGPPGSGKTTLLKALAGKMDKDLRVSGKVTYCGHELSEFVPHRTCAYISQHDLHQGELTVRETLDFSGRCLGVGTRYDLLVELSRREKEAGIKPDPEIDAFMKATAVAGQEASLVTDYVLKILGLETCADTLVGNEMIRGLSGGEKKRLTTGEMLVGPAKVFFMDGISTGFAPAASRFFRQLLALFGVHQMAISLFRFIAAIGRVQIVANTIGSFVLLVIFILGGFIIAKDNIEPWLLWCYYATPMMYGQNAIAINEFLDKRWSAPNIDPSIPEPTVGKALLRARSMFTEDYWYWIAVGALLGFSLLYNICFIVALTFLDPFIDSKSVIVEDEGKRASMCESSSIPQKDKTTTKDPSSSTAKLSQGVHISGKNTKDSSSPKAAESETTKRGMVLPFQPLSLAFNHINYYIDMPAKMKTRGAEGKRLQLLRDVCGTFRPGVLTSLVGVTGAGKTTLMDVLAGRKTGGYIEGSISISGFPKNQATFARISGYCEQNDIHSPNVTVYESLMFSAWLRLGREINTETKKMFVEEVMELVELVPVRNFLVGLPGISGLSIEQRKRLTIAVELVANPSIIFMDEPTSGLDARAAAIVLRTVRNTVDTGRTVVCTIHQPSIDIFEAFDELLLMKRGGQVLYAGPLGRNSRKLIEYFEAIPGVPKIKDGYNPATWMLEISSPAVESQLGVDFAELYANSALYQKNQELIKDLSTSPPGGKDLYFPNKYSQSFITQCKACFWKQYWSYWRNPPYNTIRMFTTIIVGLIFGLFFWNKGDKIHKEQDLLNILGAMYAAILFLGGINTTSAQPVVATERTVFYRERAAGMYSALPYAFAQVAIELIYVGIQTFVYSLILFCMMGFSWQVDKFLWFYYFMFMSFVYFTLYGMMTVALTPNHQIAAVVMSFFLVFWNLFTGFIIPRKQIPIWWRWFYWASPPAWTIYGLVTSQMGDENSSLEVPGLRNISVKVYLEERLGFEYDFLGVVAVAHILFVFIFVFVFAYGIKFFNFQRK
ncbi:hypothetical protein L6164_006836 [Bauhinia variegata]|uniref:Uncharacterized protein n=1 Tax=Bauhinia variegata TaxID=167791 RepID=A0ACB9PV31_BAUVA|nr:hypothetical protein L6164_006836 [Bauhinia variegata]